MSVSEEVLARFRALSGLFGTTFGGKRSIYETFGYTGEVSYGIALQRYIRQDIASRVVDAEPQAVWSAPPTPKGDELFIKSWNDIVVRHKLYKRLEQVDRLAGLGQFSILLIGINDGKALKTKVTPVSGKERKITFLKPYSIGNVEIVAYEESPASERFGKPVMYKITPDKTPSSSLGAQSSGEFKIKAFEVHFSRIIHVAENTLDNDLFGNPRIVRVYNLLQDIEKIAGGAAETFWLTANRGMQLDVDKDMALTEEDADALSEEVDEYIHGLTRVMRTKGVKVNTLGSDTPDPRGSFGVCVALLAGATKIPQRILLGAEAGQLASAQDRANWAAQIEDRRALFAEPTILEPFMRKCIDLEVLPAPESLAWIWPEAFRQSPLERSQTSAQQARTLANVAKALSDSDSPVTREEGRRIIESAGSIVLYDEPEDSQVSDDDDVQE